MSWAHATLFRAGLLGAEGPIVGAPITVLTAGTANVAPLFKDETKTVPLANPMPVDVAADDWGLDVAGNVKFCAEAGDYTLVWSDSNGPHGYTVSVPNNPDDVGTGSDSGTAQPGPAPWTVPTPYNPLAVYTGQTVSAPATAVFYGGSTWVPIVPAVTGIAPGTDASKWQLIAAGADVQTAITQALTAAGGAVAPHNLILGLAGSTCDPASTAMSTYYTMAPSTVVWAAMVLQTPSISVLNVQVVVPQVGTGTQVGIHAADGSLLTSMSGTAVDTWLGTAGSRDLTLTTPLGDSVLDSGQIVYVSLSQPASGIGTPAQLRQAIGVAAAVNAHNTAGFRAGTATGTTVPSVLPFGSAANSVLVYVGAAP